MAADAIQQFAAGLDSVQAAGPVSDMIKELADGVHNSHPILDALNKNAQTFTGGSHVNWNINTSKRRAKGYYKGTTLVTEVQNPLKQMSLRQARLTIDVTYYESDIEENAGPDKLQDYAGVCLDNAREDIARTVLLNILGTEATSADGTDLSAEGVPTIVGLQDALEDTPAASSTVYAGQTRTPTSYWLNGQSENIAALAALTAVTIKKMVQKCTYMGLTPNWAIMSDTAYREVWKKLRAEQELPQNKAVAEMGYPENFKFGAITFLADKHMTAKSSGGELASDLDKIWFLNTNKGLRWRKSTQNYMRLTPLTRRVDQHSFVQHITAVCQLELFNPRLNGVIYW